MKQSAEIDSMGISLGALCIRMIAPYGMIEFAPSTMTL